MADLHSADLISLSIQYNNGLESRQLVKYRDELNIVILDGHNTTKVKKLSFLIFILR